MALELITLSTFAPEKYEVRDGDRWVGVIRHRRNDPIDDDDDSPGGTLSAYKARDAKAVHPEPVFTVQTEGLDTMTDAERAILLEAALAALVAPG